MGKETLQRAGDLVLCDFDCSDLDMDTTNRLYCIAYVDGEGEHELMLVWKRGETIRSRSIGGKPTGFQCSQSHIRSFARLMSAAQDLLDGVK